MINVILTQKPNKIKTLRQFVRFYYPIDLIKNV